MQIKILTHLKRAFSTTTEKIYIKKGFIFIIFKIYYCPAIRKKAVHLYHENFPKRLNEPLQVTDIYDKTGNEQKGYSKDNAPLGVLYLFAEDNSFLII